MDLPIRSLSRAGDQRVAQAKLTRDTFKGSAFYFQVLCLKACCGWGYNDMFNKGFLFFLKSFLRYSKTEKN